MTIGLKGFQKGHKDLVTKEQRQIAGRNISLAKKGKPLTEKQKQALSFYWKSKVGKVSKKRNGYEIDCPVCGAKKYKNQRDIKRVKTLFCSKACAYKYRNQGKTAEAKRIRKSKEYLAWRTAVFVRDKYKCVLCKKKGGRLNADHIKPFSIYPDMRMVLSNGRTLCVTCHKKTDTWGNRIRNYKKFL